MDSPEVLGAHTPAAELRFVVNITPGQAGLVLPLGLQGEIWPSPRLAPLPGTSRWLLGLVNLRGTLAPVYELAGSLGWKEPPVAEQRVLILGEGEERVGMVIHGDPRPLTLHPAPAPPPPDSLARFVGSSFKSENGERYWELELPTWIHHARPTSVVGGAEITPAEAAENERDSA